MSARKIVTILVLLNFLGISTVANAQGLYPPAKTIGEKLDDVGQSIFGGLFPEDADSIKDDNQQKNKQVSQPAPKKVNPSAFPNDNSSTRSGSIVKKPAAEPIVVTPHSDSGAATAEISDQDDKDSLPLHERLSQFRRSAFDDPAKAALKPSRQTTATPSSVAAQSPQSVAGKPDTVKSASRPTPAKRPAGTASSAQPMVAERSLPTMRMDGKAVSEDPLTTKPNPLTDLNATSPNPASAGSNESGVLFARKGPVLSVESHGPRKITVGKESAYEVKIINSGNEAAEELIVFVNLPEWAEVVGAESSIGSTQAGATGQPPAGFQWKAGRLEARSQEKMVLRIVPRQSRPFDLAVQWQCNPTASQTMIEVQEPKLEMQLEGPHEVNYGKKETYRLKLLNSGTGTAEGVVIKLTPVGAGDNVSATYQLGLLQAGEDKIIEVELTARQAGMLEIQVEAKGDADLYTQLREKVLVRRAGLEIAAEGPKLQFVGTATTYSLHVRNSGNAPAKNINFTAMLPPGMKYAGGIEGARTETIGNKVQWTADSINPEASQNFTIRCIQGTAGLSRLEISATAEEDLTASAIAETQVESVANLTLDVRDPVGPVLVGDEVAYEIHVRNRGTKEAEGVEVISFFSRGIEPISAEGGTNRVGQGQVVFTPIPSLPPSAEIVFKINARADAPGNHIFRAEVHCKTLGSRLVLENTTLYYQDAPAIPQSLQARPSGSIMR